jgi:hypothetical protein
MKVGRGDEKMKWKLRTLAAALTALSLAALSLPARVEARDGDAFNDEFVYAATRNLRETDMNPVSKAIAYPVTVIVDTVALPFTMLAGLIT